MAGRKVDWDFDENEPATAEPKDRRVTGGPNVDSGQESGPSRGGTARLDRSQREVESQRDDWLSRALCLPSDQSPFPWQSELLRRFLRGEHVQSLDVPTGLGKTATMAIWLVARALGANVPRRLVYVVDRRAVVDQATDVAESLRDWVRREASVAHALGLEARPLPISTLRGQHVDNREWLEDPSAPAIVIGTVDMIGSRLLFEGYRCSRRMRSFHAALLGVDSMIVLDEAHLVPPFEAMVRVAVGDEALMPQGKHRGVVPASRVISLSATGRAVANMLQLGESDRKHDIVKRRISARKVVRFTEPVESVALPEMLANKAWELTASGKQPLRVIVFVDSRKVAQAVKDLIEKLAKGESANKGAIETELLVGGRRVAEREAAATRLKELGLIAGMKQTTQKPVFVIATSAGEVGIDLDADHAVLDLVAWERLVQRLGRVNRRGEGHANVWIVPPALDAKTKEALEKGERICEQRAGKSGVSDQNDEQEDDSDVKPAKRLKEDERWRIDRWGRLEATRRAIGQLPPSDDGFDASPIAVTDLKRKIPALIEAASTPAPLYPELTRAVLEAWSMTSLEEHTARPPVRPWLRGWVEDEPQTVVVWRTWLPNKADAKEFFEAAPVETAETLEVESTLVRDWLVKRFKQVLKTTNPVPSGVRGEEDEQREGEGANERAPIALEDPVMYVLDESYRGWTVAELETSLSESRDDLLRAIAGETVVVDTRLGGLTDTGLFDPGSNAATDVFDRHLAPLSFRVRQTENLEASSGGGTWRVEATFVSRVNDEGEPTAWLVVETDLKQQSTTADGRSTGREQRLDEHQAFAERYARGIGERSGLEAKYVDLLALSAVLHDEGKKAERWQRAFRAPKEKRPLGKTTSRPIQSILDGYRHELGSLLRAERDPRVLILSAEDRDLVLHLIAAHHGFARPILRTDGCDDAPPSALVERAREVALRFARLEKRWGPWGLAWWEALLRAADQGASRENDERGLVRG